MSYAALATDKFDEVASFYGSQLGFPVVDHWDRENGRGTRFDLGGMRLEILDNGRQREPLSIPPVGDRFHVVVEVDDIDAAHHGLAISAPLPQDTSWGARLFQIRDPDGVPVTFLQWTKRHESARTKIQGRVATGLGHGRTFTSLPWAQNQFVELLQIDPHPGTLNVIVEDPRAKSLWDQLKLTPGIRITNPDSGPGSCDARCYTIDVTGVGRAAIVLPEVTDYPDNQIEIICNLNLRDALNISDGDQLTFTCCSSDTAVAT